MRDERHLLLELRVLLEERVEGGEAAQHVLRQVRAVDRRSGARAGGAGLALVLVHPRALGCAGMVSAEIGSG